MGLDEDEDGDGAADSLYSRIKLFKTFFPTLTDVTLTVYSTVVMFMLAERSVLGLPLVARTMEERGCLALSSVMLSKVSVRDLSSVALLTELVTSRRSRLRFLMFCPAT